jgi:choice-of-anchor B domain-containing protein
MNCKRTVFTLTVILSFSLSFLQAQTNCTAGMAGIYPCNSVDLLAHVDIATLNTAGGGAGGNDIWGWTSPSTGKEYALVGLTNGTAFVDVSTPTAPIVIGHLATASTNSSWRDIKVVNNFAYIGSEAGSHHIQTFDLSKLDAATGLPVTFTADGSALIGGPTAGKSHNIFADPVSGYLGACGGNVTVGGMAFYDVSTPATPTLTGNFDPPPGVTNYTHDAVCVVYRGEDTDHIGKQICFGFNANILVAVDVTDKTAPTLIGTMTYTPTGYTHQGWITDDHNYLYLNDETDERNFGNNTRTHIIDITDLENMLPQTPFNSTLPAIDHNLYIKGNYMYQANYRAGLRILDIQDRLVPSEIASFDVYPTSDSDDFNGSWSVYPYFKSGTVIVNSIEDGLFVLQPNLSHYVMENVGTGVQTVNQGTDAVYTVDLTAYSGFSSSVGLSLSGVPVGATGSFAASISPDGTLTITISNTNLATPGNYQLLLTGDAGLASEETLSLGLIINAVLPVELVDFKASAKRATIVLNWETATELQNKGFEIQRSTKTAPNEFVSIGWVDGRGNSEISQTYSYEDIHVESGVVYYYRLRQIDEDGTEDISKIVTAQIQAFDQMVNIFPNPVADFLNVKFDAFDFPIQNVKMSVVNVNGQILHYENLNIPAGEINYQLNTNTWSEGIYILQFEVDGEAFRKRFVKM